jgi:hypothetical protein
MEKEYTNEFVKYVFSEEERRDFATEMAQKIQEKEQLESDKKSVVDDFKAQISAVEAIIGADARKMNNGYEMRQVKCEKIKDYDNRTITFLRCDTGEIVKTKDMTNEDLQMGIDEAY